MDMDEHRRRVTESYNRAMRARERQSENNGCRDFFIILFVIIFLLALVGG
jgi:hypothetical protein